MKYEKAKNADFIKTRYLVLSPGLVWLLMLQMGRPITKQTIYLLNAVCKKETTTIYKTNSAVSHFYFTCAKEKVNAFFHAKLLLRTRSFWHSHKPKFSHMCSQLRSPFIVHFNKKVQKFYHCSSLCTFFSRLLFR